jgi:hypothetical protein
MNPDWTGGYCDPLRCSMQQRRLFRNALMICSLPIAAFFRNIQDQYSREIHLLQQHCSGGGCYMIPRLRALAAVSAPLGGPFVAVQYAMVVSEVRGLVQPRHSQCGRDGPPTGNEDRPHHKHHHMLPGRCGEPVPEWLHPFSQSARHIAFSCVRHSPIPESMLRGDSPLSKLRGIVAAITLDSIT